ncbi:hypothetical protein C8R43DRAFT_609371 [Mycena crocata]|nr:hypothetical protein C8R43DRAFT_609371 [Mycena crocata]
MIVYWTSILTSLARSAPRTRCIRFHGVGFGSTLKEGLLLVKRFGGWDCDSNPAQAFKFFCPCFNSQPSSLTRLPDSSTRKFVLETAGQVRHGPTLKERRLEVKGRAVTCLYAIQLLGRT